MIDWNSVAAASLNDKVPPYSTLTEDSVHSTDAGNRKLNDLYAKALEECWTNPSRHSSHCRRSIRFNCDSARLGPALDGPFGELADIVIDPHSRVVTHVVIEPRHHHYQARLVPIGLVSADGDRIQVDLDSDRLRLLEQVVDIDYLRMTDPITVDGNWDIGTEDVLAMPYSWGSTAMTSYDDSAAMIQWDRVPKGECSVEAAQCWWTAASALATWPGSSPTAIT